MTTRVRLRIHNVGGMIRSASTETWELRGSAWHMIGGEQYWDGFYEPILATDFPNYTKCFDEVEDLS